MDKQQRAVVTVTTYGRDNQKKASGAGFFITEIGEAPSGYSLSKDTARATVTDADRKEYPVSHISGTDELCDVVKFKVGVPKKVMFLSIAHEPISQGATAYLMPYSTDKITKFGEGPVSEVSKLKEPFSYYKLPIALESGQISAPVLTTDGEVLGLAQEDVSGKKEDSYAVSAGYANSLTIQSAGASNSTHSRAGIQKVWPADANQAQVSLYLMANSQDPKTYLTTLSDFIATSPGSPNGYLSRANRYVYRRADLAPTEAEQRACLDKALEDTSTTSRFSERKGDVRFGRTKLIYDVAAADATLSREQWTVDAATGAVQKAIGGRDLPVYRQSERDIRFYKGDFEQAFTDYVGVNDSNMAFSTFWYRAAKARVNIRGANFGNIIALLSNAIVKYSSPPTNEAAPYILERMDLRLKLVRHKEAVDNYDLYYDLLKGRVGDRFFYYHEQARLRMSDFPEALADIQSAIRLSPDDPTCPAGEVSIYIRMKNHDQALRSLENALRITSDFVSCYHLRGICYVRQGKKAGACETFNKAEELGNPVADKLIKEHCR